MWLSERKPTRGFFTWLEVPCNMVAWFQERQRQRERAVFFPRPNLRSCRASLLFYSSVSGRHKFSQIQEERTQSIYFGQTENVNYIARRVWEWIYILVWASFKILFVTFSSFSCFLPVSLVSPRSIIVFLLYVRKCGEPEHQLLHLLVSLRKSTEMASSLSR